MAAVTTISTLGGQVCMDSRADELWISRMSDGTLKAGHAADISGSVAVGLDYDTNLDEFGGFVLPHYATDVDSAIDSEYLIDIVIPQGGHLYNVLLQNPGGTAYAGEPLVWSDTVPGALKINAAVEAHHTARLFDDVITGTTFATIIWGV